MHLDAVLAACERLPELGVTHRRTAISTVGWVPGIDRLAEIAMPVSLALSLHAPNDGLRSQLMPVNDRYPLAEVLGACERYRARRRRKVFVEYVMLDGVNDQPEHARQLAALLDSRQWKFSGWATVTKWFASGPSMKITGWWRRRALKIGPCCS